MIRLKMLFLLLFVTVVVIMHLPVGLIKDMCIRLWASCAVMFVIVKHLVIGVKFNKSNYRKIYDVLR